MRLTLFNVRYIGLKGEIDFTRPPYFYKAHTFLNYEWKYISTNLIDGRGSEVERFYKEEKVYDLILHVKGDATEEEYYQLLNDLTDRFEIDVANNRKAKLYCNDYYINCFVFSQEKNEYKKGVQYQEIKFKVLAPYPVWTKEIKHSFYPGQGEESGDGKGYDYKYDYMYATTGSSEVLVNHHIADSRAIITIWGYADNPLFKIGDNTYQVLETVEDGERIIINQIDKTVVKIYQNGIKENIFGKRGKEHSVFEPIKPGTNLIFSSGAFGIDITLFEERSEPKWK